MATNAVQSSILVVIKKGAAVYTRRDNNTIRIRIIIMTYQMVTTANNW